MLEKNQYLCWYPAQVDVSIRKGWFYHKKDDKTVKSVKKLMNIYVNSVGNNCVLLLNIPPTNKGVIHSKDAAVLKKLGKKISEITSNPIIEYKPGELTKKQGYLEFRFDSVKKPKYFVVSEDISKSQRVEKFDLYLLKPNGKYKKAYSGTVIGMKKIVKLKGKALGALFIVRQSRSNPVIKSIGFYE